MQYREINYEINKGKRKNIYIAIQNGKAIIKVPLKYSDQTVEKILNQKYEWIYKKIKEHPGKQAPTYQNGEIYKILGNDFKLNITYYHKKKTYIEEDYKNRIVNVCLPEKYNSTCPQEQQKEIKRQIDKLYFTICEQEVDAAMQFITSMVGLYPNEYRIRRLKRAWGNCSSTKNITINVNLAQQTRNAIQYVVLHEICHLKYMNHSKDFWNMVAKYMPNYKEAEKELKSVI